MNFKQILTLLGIISLFAGALFFLEDRYAKCADVTELSRRLDYKIEGDKLMSMQQRLWQLEDRYADKNKPPEVKQDMRKLQADIEIQKQKINRLENPTRW